MLVHQMLVYTYLLVNKEEPSSYICLSQFLFAQIRERRSMIFHRGPRADIFFTDHVCIAVVDFEENSQIIDSKRKIGGK